MATILWKNIIYGPIKSRRLGNSLGINILPDETKICSFNCIYCECGWGKNTENIPDLIVSENKIIELIEQKFIEFNIKKTVIDNITFAGNGEPTMHPEFSKIIDNIIILRDKYLPNSLITVLSNSTTCDNLSVFKALQKIDIPMMKLDAGSQEMFEIINSPFEKINIENIVGNLKKFNGNLQIQSLFLKGIHNNQILDNTTDKEIELWLKKIIDIKPNKVLIYSIDRETPAKNLEKISNNVLNTIAEKVIKNGIEANIY